ncbi:MAG: minor capsid protein [Lachnospiraceae bacterium]|nr:minor capsid protein [Lachnospiraceae bacterium]
MATVIKANFHLNGDLKKMHHLEPGGLVQQTIDKSFIDWSLQYVPARTFTLGKSAYAATQIGSGKVVYPGPYARYQYYGEIYGPNIPIFDDNSGEPTGFWSPPGKKKHPTGRPLQYSTDLNPLAGSFWVPRMKADHTEDILREAKNVAGIK